MPKTFKQEIFMVAYWAKQIFSFREILDQKYKMIVNLRIAHYFITNNEKFKSFLEFIRLKINEYLVL